MLKTSASPIKSTLQKCRSSSQIVRLLAWIVYVVLLAVPGNAFADPAAFDLTGPKLEVKVTHDGKSLPIAEVPSLSEGDQLWIKAVLPPAQAAHFLLVSLSPWVNQSSPGELVSSVRHLESQI